MSGTSSIESSAPIDQTRSPGTRSIDQSHATDWLVSLRNEQELKLAIQFCINILDFKEPRDGPLAPAPVTLWNRASELLNAQGLGRNKNLKLSAALGEPHGAQTIASEVPGAFAFAKVGPSGCETEPYLHHVWESVQGNLPGTTELVGVAYADHVAAKCISPEQVCRSAIGFGLKRLLLDTWTKSGQTSLDVLGIERLERLVRTARDHGLWIALAGSLKLSDVKLIAERGLPVDCFGARGDLCGDGRSSGLCEQRLRVWAEWFENQREHALAKRLGRGTK